IALHSKTFDLIVSADKWLTMKPIKKLYNNRGLCIFKFKKHGTHFSNEARFLHVKLEIYVIQNTLLIKKRHLKGIRRTTVVDKMIQELCCYFPSRRSKNNCLKIFGDKDPPMLPSSGVLRKAKEEGLYNKQHIALFLRNITAAGVSIPRIVMNDFGWAILIAVSDIFAKCIILILKVRGIVDVLDQVGTLAKFVLIFLSTLFALMIICYSGQRIMDESQNVSHGAYAAEWYKFSPRLKSLLIITLYRSNIPCELKAGNMIPLSIATYAKNTAILFFIKTLCILYITYLITLRRIIMLENFLREYNVNRVFLLSMGLWPFQNKSIRNFLRTFFFLIEISYCPFEILLLYDHLDNPQMIFDASYQFMMSISFIGRQINEFWNHDKASFYNSIDQHWNIFTNDMEVQVMKNYSMLSRKFTKYYSMLMFSSMLILSLIPLTPILLDTVMPLNGSRPRFFAIEVEFRVNKDDYFLPILCYSTVVILVGANVVMGVDAMHIVCTAHACSLFAAVSKRIENLISKANNNKGSSKYKYRMNMELDPLNEKLMYREYIICLKKHQLAIEFVNTLESSYQGISLLLLILLIGTISLIATRVSFRNYSYKMSYININM
ncbi:Putative odorant receptor 67a, partial [Trachymyrmex cornetzi]